MDYLNYSITFSGVTILEYSVNPAMSANKIVKLSILSGLALLIGFVINYSIIWDGNKYLSKFLSFFYDSCNVIY